MQSIQLKVSKKLIETLLSTKTNEVENCFSVHDYIQFFMFIQRDTLEKSGEVKVIHLRQQYSKIVMIILDGVLRCYQVIVK